jgi:hypothetical protein
MRWPSPPPPPPPPIFLSSHQVRGCVMYIWSAGIGAEWFCNLNTPRSVVLKGTGTIGM